ncbi:MAG: cytochrome C, partial [Acidobacteriota bacterium]|nr:cytochrome C [Acidobacteriota bacterium]
MLLLLVPGILHAQISPGPLARAHQSLNGDTNCVRCHAISTHSPQFRCVDCHREIAAELQQNKGLHATFPRSGEQGAACVKCHSDHNGANFQMIRWNPTPQGFDHSKTGF